MNDPYRRKWVQVETGADLYAVPMWTGEVRFADRIVEDFLSSSVATIRH